MRTLEEIFEKINDTVKAKLEKESIIVTFEHYSKTLFIRLEKNEKGNFNLEINNIIISNLPFKMARSKFIKALDVFC